MKLTGDVISGGRVKPLLFWFSVLRTRWEKHGLILLPFAVYLGYLQDTGVLLGSIWSLKI